MFDNGYNNKIKRMIKYVFFLKTKNLNIKKFNWLLKRKYYSVSLDINDAQKNYSKYSDRFKT